MSDPFNLGVSYTTWEKIKTINQISGFSNLKKKLLLEFLVGRRISLKVKIKILHNYWALPLGVL